MYRLLWFWVSVALLMSCRGERELEVEENHTLWDGDYDYTYNFTDYFYFDNLTMDSEVQSEEESGAKKVVGTGQVTLVLLLGLAVPHVLH